MKITVNFAMSLDGKISLKGKRVRLSCIEDKKRVHLMRNKADAILVGINTVITDDPKLTVKKDYIYEVKSYEYETKNPLRVILDGKLRIPENARLLTMPGKTIIFALSDFKEKTNVRRKLKSLEKYKNTSVKFTGEKKGLIDLHDVISTLSHMGIETLMVEGGATIISSFVEENLADEIFIYISPKIIGPDGITFVKQKVDIESNYVIKKSQIIGEGNLIKLERR